MCRLNSACRALSLCVAADRVVSIAATFPSQQKADVWFELTWAQPTVLQAPGPAGRMRIELPDDIRQQAERGGT